MKILAITLLLVAITSIVVLSSRPDAQITQAAAQDPHAAARARMVEQHLRARDISDTAVLGAMLRVPRHRFVPRGSQREAYADHPLPIGLDQTISQPYIVAYMTQAARIGPEDKVLEIGTGSGYQAAILAEIAREVYSVELLPELGERAAKVIQDLGYTNVHLRVGDGYAGWKEHAPYDAIIVTAAPERVPQALVDQLAVNGRMVIPVGGREQHMRVITRTPQGIIEERTLDVRFVPLVRTDSSPP